MDNTPVTQPHPDSATANLASSYILYRRLLRYVRPYWQAFALAMVAMGIGAIVEPIFPAILQKLLDGGFTAHQNRWDWLYYPGLLLIVFVARAVLTFVSDYLLSWVANQVVMVLRQQMFDKMMSLPASYYADHLSGQMLARITQHVTNVTNAATNVLTTLVRDSLTVLGLVVWLLYLNWQLTLFTFIIVPFIGAAVSGFSKRLRNVSRGVQDALNHTTQIVQESLIGNKIIKLYGGQAYERQRFYQATQNLRRFSMRVKVAGSLQGPIVQLFSAIALSSLMATALYQAAHQQTSVGGFVSFITAVGLLMSPIKRLTDINAPLQAGLVAAETVFQLIDEASEVDLGTVQLLLPQTPSPLQSPTNVPAKNADNHISSDNNKNIGTDSSANANTDNNPVPLIEFDHISFTYPNSQVPALNNLTMKIYKGECIGLVGPSGSGKSSLVHLLPRFFLCERGEIRIAGHPLSTLTLASLRQNIALVSQEVVLFNDSIAANISYGKEHDRQAITEAARQAYALEFIEALPQGFDTIIGENGVKLSGGQRQRLAIARAILKDSPILILDEATSALDTESERHVQMALNHLMRDRTSIVIAHRLSTIEHADRIFVLEAGNLVESGKHAELLNKNGLYARLVQLQHLEL